MTDRSTHELRPLWQFAAMSFAGLFALALMSTQLSRTHGGIASLWLSDAFAAAALLARRRRDWPVLLAVYGLANVLADVAFGDRWLLAASFMPANLVTALLAAWLIERHAPLQGGIREPQSMMRMLLAGTLVPGVVGATVASFTVGPLIDVPPSILWPTWATAVMLGGISALPLGVLLAGAGQSKRRAVTMGAVGRAALAVLGAGASMTLFHNPYIYLGVLLVGLAATSSLSATAMGVLGASVIARVAIAGGFSQALFAGHPWTQMSLDLTQAVALLPALLLAAQRAHSLETQARFDALYTYAPEAIFLGRADGSILAANPAAQKLLGIDERAIVEGGRHAVVDTSDERLPHMLSQRERHGFATGMLRFRRADGSTFDGDTSSARYELPSGEIGTHVFMRDASDRVAQQQALEASEELLHRLSDQVPGVLYTLELRPDGSMRMPFVSRAYESITGLPRETVTDSPDVSLQIIHPDDRAAVIEGIAVSASSMSACQLEFRVTTRSDDVRWMSMQSVPMRMDDGTVVWHGYMTDVTARRTEEARRAEEQARTDLALASARIGIWECDFRTGMLVFNDNWADMLGYAHGELEPRVATLERLVHPDDQARVLDPLRWAPASDERAQPLVVRMQHRDGSWRWIEMRSMVTDREERTGAPLRVNGTHIDVTERVEREALRMQRDRADAANLAKTQFMSRVSHELRTPLNAVLGFAQLLDADSAQPLAPGHRQHVLQILNGSEHLLSLINDLLDVSRIEAQELPFNLESVRVRAAVDKAVGAIDPLARSAGVQIEVSAIDPDLHVHADHLRLQQVLLNLLSNAVKFNHSGGRLAVRVSREVTDAEWASPCVALSVTDTGRGLTAEQLRHLFEPFNRLGAEASGVEGTGLGLVIARRLVLGMGGEMDVSSTPGQGSEFTVRLRVAEPHRTAPSGDAAAAGPDASAATTRRMRVLYAEDNPVNALLVEEMTRLRPSVDLEIVESGAAALASARARTPDLLLADMNLGDMVGLELIAKLKSEPSMQGVPCVALSADALPAQIDAAMSAGFVDYITKPLKMSALLDLYDRLAEGALGARGAHAPS